MCIYVPHISQIVSWRFTILIKDVHANYNCAGKFTCHVMHRARVQVLKWAMIGQMAIITALLGFNDLGRSVTANFLFRNRFYLQLSPHCPKMKKNQCGKLKKFQDFCPRDMKSCHPAAAKRVKLWGLNANLFFGEHQQLTKFVWYVHLNHIWQRTFSFKALIAIFWNLQPLWPSSLTKPDLLRFRRSSGNVLSKTKSVTPHFFFTFLTSLTHHLSLVNFSEKNQR